MSQIPESQPGLGQWLKIYRDEHELTQAEIARRLDVDPSLYRRWESGRSMPRPSSLDKIRGLVGPERPIPFETFSDMMVEATKTAKRGLRGAVLCVFRRGGDISKKASQQEEIVIKRWATSLDHRIDGEFFPHLWTLADAPVSGMREWGEKVRGWGAEVLEQMLHSTPMPDARRYKIVAGAERLYYGTTRGLVGILTREEEQEIQDVLASLSLPEPPSEETR